MVGSLRWKVVKEFLSQVAVRIDQADAVPCGNVLNDQVAQKCRLAHAGFTDDVHVVPAIFGVHAKKRGVTAPQVTLADVNGLVHGTKANRHSCHVKQTPSSFESLGAAVASTYASGASR